MTLAPGTQLGPYEIDPEFLLTEFCLGCNCLETEEFATAIDAFQRLQAEPQESRDPVHSAWVLASLAENGSALESLEEAYAQRAPMLVSMPTFPWWDPLRAEPRFQALLRRMNFPETSGPREGRTD